MKKRILLTYATQGLYPVTSKKQVRKKWLDNNELYLAQIDCLDEVSERVVTPFMGKDDSVIDVITGSIYNVISGVCASTNQLKLLNMRKDVDKCLLIFSNIKVYSTKEQINEDK